MQIVTQKSKKIQNRKNNKYTLLKQYNQPRGRTMVVRPDTKILTTLVEKKHLSLQEAKAISRLPLIDIMNESLIKELNQEYGDIDLGLAIDECLSDGIDQLGFNEFIFLSRSRDEIMHFVLDAGGRVEKFTIYMEVGWLRVFNISTADDHSEFQTKSCPVELTTAMEGKDPRTGEPLLWTYYEATWSEFYYVVKAIQRFHRKDLYAVTKEPAKKKPLGMGVKNEIHKVSGPSVVWLPSLPKKSSSHSGEGTGEERKPHHRRGHFKTLRAERYKNHPKYGMENAIYVKPAWIGDKEAIVDGTIYRYAEKVLTD